MQWSGFIRRLFQEAEPYLAVRGDMAHTRVSHKYALILITEEGGNARIVEPAIILHDVGWSRLEPEDITIAFGVLAEGEEAERLNRIHELEGASIAGQILQSLDYDPLLIEKITSIIRTHDSGIDIRSPEEGIVKDADKLWRSSKVGFWQEAERQHLDPEQLHRFLNERYKEWFFTSTALTLAGEDLEERAKEIDVNRRDVT
ncbi:MAG: HD domain-containing protein [Deltaproteobacteria bacterium]|nr:HD domain-containing protein [Deltaproteobacteria bacterium]